MWPSKNNPTVAEDPQQPVVDEMGCEAHLSDYGMESVGPWISPAVAWSKPDCC
jgi:hypothetical protein